MQAAGGSLPGRQRPRLHLAAALALLLCCAPAAAAPCPLDSEDGSLLGNDTVQLAWRTEAAEIVVGRPFVLLLRACPADARLLRVDATMPEHRHGMNYLAAMQALGPGHWRVEGLLWHMAGRWELQFELQVAGQLHTLRHSVTLP